jgi:hypothetical protein
MKVVLTGGTGFIGRAVVRALLDRGDAVVCLVRNVDRARAMLAGTTLLAWDAEQAEGEWVRAIDGADAVVHLAGEPVLASRWSTNVKHKIVASREDSTRHLVDAIGRAAKKPSVFVCASGVDYYGDTGDRVTDEHAPMGSGFLSHVCEVWEREAARAAAFGVREVRLRTGIVVGESGGAVEKMITPFKFFVGGPVGGGSQWVSWIGLEDTVRVVLACLDDARLRGPVNVVGPEPIRMTDFSRALGQALGRPSWAPVPGFALRVVVGEASEVLVAGKRIVPRALEAIGFEWKERDVQEAMRRAVGRP